MGNHSAQRACWTPNNYFFFYAFDVFPYTLLIDEHLKLCNSNKAKKKHLLGLRKVCRISKWPTSCLKFANFIEIVHSFSLRKLDFVQFHMKLMKPMSIDQVWPVLSCFVRPFITVQYICTSFLSLFSAPFSSIPCHFQYLRSRLKVKFEVGW